ncbi:Imm1 family immunity protein [Sorangium sp. So ce1078]|uniref:Imm1 family immunity protein n=1 Tax=Sorangium sp. So ce1078 TaxID=3133329 RepID=UPI003F5DE838
MQELQAASIPDVERILDELHENFVSEDPQLVTVESNETGDSLAIGLGRDRSVLNYVSSSKDPPYFTSTGELEVDEPIAFRFGGEWSEFPMRNSVPSSVARQAMMHLCITGRLSSVIQWEQD